MNKELLKHYYEEGKKFGYALARGATDLPSVQTFDELYTEQLNKPLVMQAEGSDVCKHENAVIRDGEFDYCMECCKQIPREGATVASEGQGEANTCADCGREIPIGEECYSCEYGAMFGH